jgi:Ni,Fe-hydrogenase I large subunit
VENGVQFTNAWSSGNMARGIEVLLQDIKTHEMPHTFPAASVVVCEGVHAIASSFCLDNAFDVEVPRSRR